MIDLQLISRLIDAALAQETTESVDAFLAAHPDAVSEAALVPLAEQVIGFTGAATNVPLQPSHGSFVTAGYDAITTTVGSNTPNVMAGDYSYAMAA